MSAHKHKHTEDVASTEPVLTSLGIAYLRRAEENLKTLDARLQHIFNTLGNSFWGADLVNRKMLYASPANAKVFGYTEHEFMNNFNLWHEVIIPEDKDIGDWIRSEVYKGKPFNCEYRIRHKDGSIRWIEARMTPASDEKGNVILLDGIAIDITERKSTEAKLHQSKEQFKSIVNSLNHAQKLSKTGSFEFNLHTFELVWSEEQYRIFEMEEMPAHLLFEACKKKIHPDDIPALNEAIRLAVKEGRGVVYEHRIFSKDGTIKYLVGTGEVYTTSGNAKVLRGSVQDITERKLFELNQKENEKRLLEAQKVAQIGDFTYDFRTGIWKCSRVLDEITGLNDDAIMVFDNWVALLTDDVKEEIVSTIFPLLQNGTMPQGHYLDCKIKRANTGEERWVSIVGELERDAMGKPLQLKGTVQDITERKKSEFEIKRLNELLEKKVEERTIELSRANKDLEAFNYTVSHDLQNPLASLSGFSKLLLHTYSDKLDNEGKEYLKVIDRSAKRMSSLVRDLLSFSQLGKVVVRKSEVDMDKLVRNVTDDIVFTEGRLKTRMELHPLKPAVCDPALIRQVWENLISNALKYSSRKENPVVEIGCSDNGSEYIYFVKDNGIGFDNKDAVRIFRVFERVNHSAYFEGTGVGLAIVERIIAGHVGRVWAEGETGKGACFYFSLPKESYPDLTSD